MSEHRRTLNCRPAVPAGSFLDAVPAGSADLESRYDLILTGVVEQDFNEHFIFGKNVPEIPLEAGIILLVIGPTHAIDRLKHDLAGTSAGGQFMGDSVEGLCEKE